MARMSFIWPFGHVLITIIQSLLDTTAKYVHLSLYSVGKRANTLGISGARTYYISAAGLDPSYIILYVLCTRCQVGKCSFDANCAPLPNCHYFYCYDVVLSRVEVGPCPFNQYSLSIIHLSTCPLSIIPLHIPLK